MKKIALMALMFVSACLAGAGELRNLLANPDFSSGMAHWEVEGKIGTVTPKNGSSKALKCS